MEKIHLMKPEMAHLAAAEELKREFFDHGERFIHGSASFHQMEYSDWLHAIRNNSDPQTVRKGWVVASTFFAMRENDEKLIGVIDVRHSIDTDFLSQYSGHIGYAVRPSERRKGYAAAMLREAIVYAKWLGLSKVMVSCDSGNQGSRKTIEACGGILVEKKPYSGGLTMLIYWIAL